MGQKGECKFCSEMIELADFFEHYETCTQTLIVCNLCGKTVGNRQELEDHIKTDCTAVAASCAFKSVGCPFVCQRTAMDQHMDEYNQKHLLLIVAKINQPTVDRTEEINIQEVNELKTVVSDLQNVVSKQYQDIFELASKVAKQQIVINDVSEREKKKEKKMKEQDDSISNMCSEIETLRQELRQTRGHTSELYRSVEKVKKDLPDLTVSIRSEIQEFKEEVRESQEAMKIDASKQAFSEIQSAIVDGTLTDEKQRKDLFTLKSTFSQHSNKWSSQMANYKAMKITIDRLLNSGPSILWKITNFSKKRNKREIVHSPEFYTGMYGYRMKCSLHPNGNKTGQNTHMSIYIYFEPGEYDNILKWPFRCNASFTLLDQDGGHNVTMSFDQKDFLKPPVDGVGSDWGYDAFVSHDDLSKGNYVKDNIVYIRICVTE